MDNLSDALGLLAAQTARLARNEKKGKTGLMMGPVKMSDASKLVLTVSIAFGLLPVFAIATAIVVGQTGGVEGAGAVAGASLGLLIGVCLILWGIMAQKGKCVFCGSWRVKEFVAYSSGSTDYYDRECKRCGMSQNATPF